jgi:hypothetical protein
MGNSNFEDNTNRNRNKKCSLCKRLAEILGAEVVESREDLCVVGFNRDLDVEILGVRTRSPLVLPVLFSFEPARNKGCNGNGRNNINNENSRDDRNNERTLNLGKTNTAFLYVLVLFLQTLCESYIGFIILLRGQLKFLFKGSYKARIISKATLCTNLSSMHATF